jgi:hypothetical protein
MIRQRRRWEDNARFSFSTHGGENGCQSAVGYQVGGNQDLGGSGTACFGREAREVRDMTSGLALLVKIFGDDRKAMCSIGQLQQSIKGGEVAKGRERDL